MTATLSTSLRRLAARTALLLTLAVCSMGAAFAQTITYFHNDVAGTPLLATNAAGAVVWKENYLPYGYRQAAEPASSGNKLWFTGKPYDPDTQLSYMGARYYMPLLGRFTGIDPVGIVPEQPHSFNRYAYANNNPYKYVDPDGRQVALAWKLGSLAVAIGTTLHIMSPEQRMQMARSASQFVSDALGRAPNLVFNEGGGGADTPAATPTESSPDSASAADKAKELGYDRKVKDPPFNPHGQPVFTNGKDFITPDADQHNGGEWKGFDRRGNRTGTYDGNLDRIGK